MAFVAFLGVFALDVFDERRGLAETAVALALHLIPNAVLAVVIALSWRRGWIGTVLFGAAGVMYVLWLVPRPQPAPAMKLLWIATIAGPTSVIAALYWLEWRQHDGPRADRPPA
jgi:hypothetical protein